jgi:hypothetical protein
MMEEAKSFDMLDSKKRSCKCQKRSLLREVNNQNLDSQKKCHSSHQVLPNHSQKAELLSTSVESLSTLRRFQIRMKISFE